GGRTAGAAGEPAGGLAAGRGRSWSPRGRPSRRPPRRVRSPSILEVERMVQRGEPSALRHVFQRLAGRAERALRREPELVAFTMERLDRHARLREGLLP